MNKFTSGMIAGGLIGAVGIAYVLNDKKTRRRMVRDGKRMASKIGTFIEDIKV